MTKNSLSKIIESLTANEKRNFHLTNSATREQNFYQVYKAMEKDPSIGNTQLKKKVRNKRMNVSYEKMYLHKVLSRSLRNFYEDNTISITLQQNLIDTEILYTKGLTKPAIELIKSSALLAERHAAFLISLQLLHWQLKCLVQLGNFMEVAKFITSKANLEKEIHARQIDYENAVFLKASLAAFFIEKGLSNSEQNKKSIPVKLKAIEAGLKRALSFSAFLQYAEALVFYYNTIGQVHQGIEISEKVLLRYDSNPALKYRFSSGYISTLGNYCQHIIIVGDLSKKAQARIKEYQGILSDKKIKLNESDRTEVDLTVKLILFDLHSQKGDFVTILPVSQEVAANFPASVEELRSDQATSLCLISSITLLLNGQTEKALLIINYSIHRFRDKTRQDIYFCFQILYLLAQFDIGNYKVLPSLIKAVYRFWKKRALATKSPYLVLKLLTELIKSSGKNYDAILENCFRELEKLSEHIEEDLFLGSTKILHWIKRKRNTNHFKKSKL